MQSQHTPRPSDISTPYHTNACVSGSSGSAQAGPYNEPLDHLDFSTAQIEEHVCEHDELVLVHKSDRGSTQLRARHEGNYDET
eukprot:12905399-Prorocentrum_lima.AAC.1